MITWMVVAFVVAGAFLFGRYLSAAAAAHGRFTSYRTRTVTSLTSWIRNAAKAVLVTALLLVLVYYLLR